MAVVVQPSFFRQTRIQSAIRVNPRNRTATNGNGRRVALTPVVGRVCSLPSAGRGFVSSGNSGGMTTSALPRKARKGDLHTVIVGRIEDGSAGVQIYLCEQSGDGTPGNHAAWTPYQLGANQQQWD